MCDILLLWWVGKLCIDIWHNRRRMRSSSAAIETHELSWVCSPTLGLVKVPNNCCRKRILVFYSLNSNIFSTRSREASKSREYVFKWTHWFNIRRAHLYHCGRDASQSLAWVSKCNHISARQCWYHISSSFDIFAIYGGMMSYPLGKGGLA